MDRRMDEDCHQGGYTLRDSILFFLFFSKGEFIFMKTLTELCKHGRNYLNDNGANILTGLGVIGVAGTAILTAKATPKAIKLLAEKEMYKQENYDGEHLTKFEKVLAVLPAYLPAILMGTATATCILGANHINNVKQANLIAAYTCLNSSYQEYRNKVKDIFGEEGEKRVIAEMEKEHYISEKYGDPTEKRLFYDEYSKRYFEMSFHEVLKATYEANRMYAILGEMSLNQLYEFFGLKPTEIGDQIGWNSAKDWECYNFAWLDIHWVSIETPDNLEAFAITFNIDPSKDFLEW